MGMASLRDDDVDPLSAWRLKRLDGGRGAVINNAMCPYVFRAPGERGLASQGVGIREGTVDDLERVTDGAGPLPFGRFLNEMGGVPPGRGLDEPTSRRQLHANPFRMQGDIPLAQHDMAAKQFLTWLALGPTHVEALGPDVDGWAARRRVGRWSGEGRGRKNHEQAGHEPGVPEGG